MTVIVTDEGFGPDAFEGRFATLETNAANAEPGTSAPALDLPSDTDPETLSGRLGGISMIRVDFPSFADGRGFSIAKGLRRLGYAGRLRARGHVLADQYAMARRSGFDEVEISDDLAQRQPEDQWRFRADWRALDHRAHLAGPAATG